MNLTDRLLQIPIQYRAAIYSGPFFVLWILGYAIEQGERTRVAAGRGLVLLLTFLGYHAVVLLGFEILKSFLSVSFALDMVNFVLKSIGGLAYLSLGAYLAIQEVRNAPVAVAALDTRAKYLETLLNR
ncbi:MAG: hypothetical protein JNM27_10260 [Leptospirales bacterium]|nr:hypothetical protein [Leptospirales bacterium]